METKDTGPEFWGPSQMKALLDIYRLSKVVLPYAKYGVYGAEEGGNLFRLHSNACAKLSEAIERFEKTIPTVEA